MKFFFEFCAGFDVNDVTENENSFDIETNSESFNYILENIVKKILIPKFSELDWKPINLVEITNEEHAKTLLKLLEALEDLDDVQNVASNFNINEALMEKII